MLNEYYKDWIGIQQDETSKQVHRVNKAWKLGVEKLKGKDYKDSIKFFKLTHKRLRRLKRLVPKLPVNDFFKYINDAIELVGHYI